MIFNVFDSSYLGLVKRMFLIDDLVNNKLQVKPDTIPVVVAAYLIFLMVKTKRILPVKLH